MVSSASMGGYNTTLTGASNCYCGPSLWPRMGCIGDVYSPSPGLCLQALAEHGIVQVDLTFA